jgi:hypothetical protein
VSSELNPAIAYIFQPPTFTKFYLLIGLTNNLAISSFIAIKPDGVQVCNLQELVFSYFGRILANGVSKRGLVGDIIARFEKRG